MKLFFETAAQASVFLMIMPIGMLLAVCIDLAGCARRTRPLWDVLAVLLCCALVGFSVVILGDERLRIYHVLAVIIGALLYLSGFRSVAQRLLCRARKQTKKKDTNSCRNVTNNVE